MPGIQEDAMDPLNNIVELINGLNMNTQVDERIRTIKILRSNILPLRSEEVQRLIHTNQLDTNKLFYIFGEINNNAEDADELIIKNETIDIFEKFLSSFHNICQIFDTFSKEIISLFSQSDNEKLQSICLQRFSQLIRQIRLGKGFFLINIMLKEY